MATEQIIPGVNAPPIYFNPSVTLPQGGVSGQAGEQGKQTKLSEGGESSKSPFDFNQMMMAWMMNMMNPNVQGAGGAPAVQAAPAQAAQVNPTLGALLQHFGSGATRRTMGGQIEGTPAPDPFTNLNAMRDSQQAHDLSRMRHSIEMQKLRDQGGVLPQGAVTHNAEQVRAALNARQGLGDSTFGADAVAANPEYHKVYGPAPLGPDWTTIKPQWNETWLTDPMGSRFEKVTNAQMTTPAPAASATGTQLQFMTPFSGAGGEIWGPADPFLATPAPSAVGATWGSDINLPGAFGANVPPAEAPVTPFSFTPRAPANLPSMPWGIGPAPHALDWQY